MRYIYVVVCALRVLKYATSGHRGCCEKLISVGGLKFVFPTLLGRGLPKLKRKKSGKGSSQEIEETAIGLISQLVTEVHDSLTDDACYRLLIKFTENEREKLERCCELFIKYFNVLKETEKSLELTAIALKVRIKTTTVYILSNFPIYHLYVISS